MEGTVRMSGLVMPVITEFHWSPHPLPSLTSTRGPGRCTAFDKLVIGLGFPSATSSNMSLWNCLGAQLELLSGSHGSAGRPCSLSQVAQAQGLAHNPDPRLHIMWPSETTVTNLGFLLPLLLLVHLKTGSKKGLQSIWWEAVGAGRGRDQGWIEEHDF